MSPPSSVVDRLHFALECSREAEQLVLSYFQQSHLSVDQKSDSTPVTAADRGAEELLRRRILERFPQDAVLGEEFGETPGSSSFRWILDPVDGTKSFIHGVPLFGMLIGLLDNNIPVAGICRLPALGECIYASRGEGAWWQRQGFPTAKATTTSTTRLDQALFCFTDLECWRNAGQEAAQIRVSRACRLSRGWGDCYGHMLVATGRADVMIDPMLAVWDAAPLLPILQEAGGAFVDWQGVATISGGNGLSVTPALQHSVLRLLQSPRA